ncbi:hypothetical protein G6F29_012152 [Rhizopus arrhizus]|nr:hypothetical protein G6F29_012152 [Rhizopus arrhizus]KAG1002216.1 hypothetical protein G6F27_012164 [Rhizopus arrhizus]KAG1087210.1 hypothetical protein G6F39_012108 [Rhizopus arrhizus]
MSTLNTDTTPMASARQNGGHLTRFLSDIKDFGGSTNYYDHGNSRALNNPLTWLKKLDRLKELARLGDKEALLIAADHLVGKAEMWFDVVCCEIKTWSEFQMAFKKKYCVGLEDMWWGQIRQMKQGDNESVDDVDIKLRELFALVQVTDQRLMVRAFLDAIDPGIAWEVERSSGGTGEYDLDDIVARAARYEMVMQKYRSKGVVALGSSESIQGERSVGYGSTYNPPSHKDHHDAHSVNSSATIDNLLKEFRELKISLVQSAGNQQSSNRNMRGLTCFFCNKEGHKKPECPDWLATRKQDSYATGVFEVPLNPQNPSNTQKGSSAVNLVDSIPAVEVYATSHPAAVEVNATKRPGSNEPGPSRPPPNLRPNLVPPVATAPNVASGVASGAVPPMMTLPSLINPVRARKPVRRRPVRRLPISIRRHDVWRKLDEVNAGLSMTEWLMLDSQASSDLMDGVRTMRSRKKKVTPGPDGRQTVTVKPSKPKANTMAPMVVGAVDLWDDGRSDWEDHTDDSSEFTEVSSEGSKSDEQEAEGTNDSIDLEQAGSHTGYPYDLHELRRSAPLKGPVSVNGIVFECTFDSGAAVSVMSEALAHKLGLNYNGDQIHLTSFDSLPREPCNIVPNVPIRVGGHLRAEHMCIQASPHNSQDEYCILGMTWFRNYGASIRAQDNVVMFPTSVRVNEAGALTPDWSGGMLEIQCYSSHDGDGLYSYSSTDAKANTSIGRSQVLAVSVAMVDGATKKEEIKMDLATYMEEVAEASDQEQGEEGSFCLNKVPNWLQDLVTSHKETFVEVSGLGRVDLATHEIPTLPGTTPIKSRPFRLTWDEQAQMAKELEEMVAMDLIRPSKGVWSSPCFFILDNQG